MLGYKKWDEHLGPLAVKKWKQIQSCRFSLSQKPLLCLGKPLLEKAVFTRFYCQYSWNLQANRLNGKFKISSENR